MNSYSSLKDIASRKELVRKDIARDTSSITKLFDETFIPKTNNRQEKISTAVNIGLMAYDVTLLALKLNSKYELLSKGAALFKKLKK